MKLKNVSATQVDTYTACPRAWHFGWPRGFKTPPTAAMQRGTHIHSAAEFTVKHNGTLPTNQYAPYAEAMLPFLPIGQPKVLVEQPIRLETGPGLPPWIGYIDLLDDSRTLSPYLRITDHKTSSDFRYAKTPAELAENTQVISYAKYVFDSGHDEELVQVGHLYVHTKGDALPKRSLPKVLPVFTEVGRAQVEQVWARDLGTIEEMVRAAEVENTDLLEPRGTSNGQCQKYGGCPHRARCGISASPKIGTKREKEPGTMSNNFLARMQAAAAAKAGGTPSEAASVPQAVAKPVTPPPAAPQAAKPATGVLPPDAPSRTTPIKAKVAPVEAPAVDPRQEIIDKWPDADAEQAAAAPAPAKRPIGRPRKEKALTSDQGFVLFIDCMPVKDTGGDTTTMFEDWINPIRLTLNDEAMKAKNLPDYRLLPFAEEKALFAIAVNEQVGGGMPAALIVNSSSPGARDALDVLIPHARLVVRGLRG